VALSILLCSGLVALLREAGGLWKVEAVQPGTLLLSWVTQSRSSDERSLVNAHIWFQRQSAGRLQGRAGSEETFLQCGQPGTKLP